MTNLTATQLRTLRLAADEQQSTRHFGHGTVRKLLDLGLVDGIGTGTDFAFWATDDGRELILHDKDKTQ